MTKNNTKIFKFHNTDSKLVELMCNVHEKVTLAFYDLQKKRDIYCLVHSHTYVCTYYFKIVKKKKKKNTVIQET